MCDDPRLFDFNPFEKDMFSKVKNQPVEISIQPVVLHLVFLKRIWKSLTLLDFAVKQI